MNILILNWRGPGHPLAGGAEFVTHEHAKAWVKAGHRVTLFTSSFKNAKHTVEIDGIRIIRKGPSIGGVQLFACIWYLFGKHESFDLVVDQFHGIPFFTPLYVRVKKLGFIHEVARKVWKLNPWSWPFNYIPWVFGSIFEQYFFKVLYKRVTFMTVSNSTAMDLRKWSIPKNNIYVIHNGFYPHTTMRKKETIFTCMFLGSLAKDKGIEDAIRTFGRVFKQIPSAQFWIVGKSEQAYLKFLKELCQKEGISNASKFWGFVEEKKKFELLAAAHVLINPSTYEGWGLVNIEANSVGTPVIGYKVAGIVDSVKNNHTGLLVNAGDYKQLAYMCIQVHKNKTLYKRLSENAIQWSKVYTWEESTRQSLQLITKL